MMKKTFFLIFYLNIPRINPNNKLDICDTYLYIYYKVNLTNLWLLLPSPNYNDIL